MTPVSNPKGGLELVWVNASPTGPTSENSADPQHHHIVRVQHGRNVTIARSSSSDRATLVNDLDNNIYFPLAKVISREHASIEWLESAPIIKDLGSTHGTYLAHRQASVLATGQIVEDAPLAPLHTLVGILPLRDGDLIQFGKGCSRSDASYHPVRCYIRFLPAPPSLSSHRQGIVPLEALSIKKTHPYSLLDDPLDSESEVVSIDAETFRAGSFVPTIQPSPAPVILPSLQTTVVDLSGDDDDNGPETDSPPSACHSGSEFGASNYDEHENLDLADSVSENSTHCSDFQHVPWHHEIQEVRGERLELDSEAREANLFGPQYMRAYRSSRDEQSTSPATSISAGSAHIPDLLLCKNDSDLTPETTHPTVGDPSPKAMPASQAFETVEPPAAINAHVVEPSSELDVPPISGSEQNFLATSSADSPGAARQEASVQKPTNQAADVQQPASESGPNCDSDEPILTRKRKAIHFDDNSAEDPDDNDSGSSSEFSALATRLQTPCTSSSGPSSPSKRSRNTQHDDDCHVLARTSSRGRKFRGFVAKAVYATGLLSLGFFTGSLFTFKSMLNAAAAANAAGSGSQ